MFVYGFGVWKSFLCLFGLLKEKQNNYTMLDKEYYGLRESVCVWLSVSISCLLIKRICCMRFCFQMQSVICRISRVRLCRLLSANRF